MKTFDVYQRYEIEPVKGEGCHVWDKQGTKYLDFYGGHSVISVGHSHPHYIQRIQEQVTKIGFYSNSVQMSIQEELAEKLGKISRYEDYSLFLCNSGAEANENALKLASFHTGKKKIIVFERGFHGRTSLAVEATDNHKIQAPINHTGNFIRLPFNNLEALSQVMDETVAGVLIEGIQGIGGIHEPSKDFLIQTQNLCKEYGAAFILDEIQSGYGRTGVFFAHQASGIKPDIISVAKGMGNGFPMGGILISPEFKASTGLLGTTFGGNHLACAAGLAVLEILESEQLINNAKSIGNHLLSELEQIESIKAVRGRGLMIGLDLDHEVKSVRSELLFKHMIFTGSALNPYTLRILPPLCIKEAHADQFIHSLLKVLAK